MKYDVICNIDIAVINEFLCYKWHHVLKSIRIITFVLTFDPGFYKAIIYLIYPTFQKDFYVIFDTLISLMQNVSVYVLLTFLTSLYIW